MENLNYKMNATFDEPVVYKGVKIYPITLRYYHLVKVAYSAFAINQSAETDLELIGLPYMEYLYKKAQKDENFADVWNIFNSILQLSFKEQIFSFKYEGDFLKLTIAVPTDKYNENTMCEYREKLSKYRELAKDQYHVLLNQNQITNITKELDIMAKEMFEFHTFNDKEFGEIKDIICFLNDIDTTIIDPRWEKELKEASEIMAQLNGRNDYPELEDMINAVAMELGKLPTDIETMTIRRFDRYLHLITAKEEYKLARGAELSGQVTFKTPIKHWLSSYKVKSRYAEAQNNGSNFIQK